MISLSAQDIGSNDVLPKKTKYIKQKDECSCGPVALLNLHKWLGQSLTYKDLSRIKQNMGWPFDMNPNEEGTPSICMTLYILKHFRKFFVKHSQYKINVRLNRKITTLLNHLDQGRAVIFTHPAIAHPKDKILNWHYSLFIKEQDRYMGINYYKNVSYYPITKEEIKLLFRRGGKAIEYWVFSK